MNICRVHHVAIICSNYEVSKDFYNRILGFKAINEVYRKERDSYKLDLCVGEEYQIELFSFPSPPERPSFPEAAGLRHFSICCYKYRRGCEAFYANVVLRRNQSVLMK